MSGNPYRNPFSRNATIPVRLDAVATVRIDLIDLLGRVVTRVLPPTSLPLGAHGITLNGGALPSGMYIVRVDVDGRIESRAVALVR